MKRITAILLTTALAAPVHAGALSEPVVEPVIAPAPVIAAASRDWTGFYIGGALGYGEISNLTTGSGMTYGGYAGYDHDFGNFVLGAEFQVDGASINTGLGPVNSLMRGKLRAGFGAGDVLVYGTGGAAHLNVGGTSGWGYFGGIGAEVALNRNWSLGGELLYHQFNNFGGAGTVNATTAQARVTFRF